MLKGAPPASLIFDGDCGFCENFVSFAQRRGAHHLTFQPYQSVDLDLLGLNEVACQSSAFATEDGQVIAGGASAIAYTLRAMSRPWPTLGFILDLQGVRQLAGVVYTLIARNRHWIQRQRGGKSCSFR